MESLEQMLNRWVAAGVLPAGTAEAIRVFEAGRDPERHLRWPALLALAFGTLMIGGGVLLFVAAHWDRMSPSARLLTVLTKVVAFHLAGALTAERLPRLATAFHGLGTLALGAGIFLAGQIFNLAEHWPGGVMLWALGAWLGFALRRDWVQGLLAALLTPAWLGGEWAVATESWRSWAGGERILAFGLLVLALTYFTARRGAEDRPLRKALMWAGGLAVIPLTIFVLVAARAHASVFGSGGEATPGLLTLGWLVATLLPLALALRLRGRGAWMNAAAAGWVWLLGIMNGRELPLYAWCALGSVGLVAWGLHEARRERVNLGVAGFAITLLAFYFSSVMDKLGRSLGLMGLGALFLLGGWQLERLRRRLNARILEGGVR